MIGRIARSIAYRSRALGRRAAERVRRARERGAVILLYHRVAELPRDPQLLAVRPGRFAEQMTMLRRHWRPVSLRQLTRELGDGSVRRGTVCITFDDGYEDNLVWAKPALAAADVPATVFVTAGAIGSDEGLWWDELEHLLLEPGRLPETVAIAIEGSATELRLGAYDPARAARDRSWSVLSDEDPSPRHAAYRDAYARLRFLSPEQRRAALQAMRQALGRSGVPASHRVMNADGIRQLAAGGLVEVGAHTMNHPSLRRLPEVEQHAEIRESKRRLEDIVAAPVTSFAYPYGTINDYDAAAVRLARESGFERACSNFAGRATSRSDPFQLPRHVVRDWDADTLNRHLREWSQPS
jgi:peptidoglycan/xylan/chitin deacetylase (PgdA/CDA1 family)